MTSGYIYQQELGLNHYYCNNLTPLLKNFSFGGRYFESDDLKQVLSRLNLLKTTRGIGMITAPPGMGKSWH